MHLYKIYKKLHIKYLKQKSKFSIFNDIRILWPYLVQRKLHFYINLNVMKDRMWWRIYRRLWSPSLNDSRHWVLLLKTALCLFQHTELCSLSVIIYQLFLVMHLIHTLPQNLSEKFRFGAQKPWQFWAPWQMFCVFLCTCVEPKNLRNGSVVISCFFFLPWQPKCFPRITSPSISHINIFGIVCMLWFASALSDGVNV